MPIKDWSEDDRPREKLMSNGAEACSVAELIAILITNGTATAYVSSVLSNPRPNSMNVGNQEKKNQEPKA